MLKKLVSCAMCMALLLSLCLITNYAYAAPGNGKGNSAKERAPKKQHNVKPAKDKSINSDKSKKKDHDDFTLDGGDLVKAGITAALARNLATDSGFTGYSSLPPGIAKNLARGKPLPPGIAKKAVPAGMLKNLPSYKGYEWQVAGKDLVLVQLGSMVIADVLRDVFN